MIATEAVMAAPVPPAIRWRSAPSSTTERQSPLSVPACGNIAEWYISAPAREARHWKKHTASAPRATYVRLFRRSWLVGFAAFTGCQLTALVEDSMRIHG